MESDEGFRLVFFFQGLWMMLYHFVSRTWVLVDDRGSVLRVKNVNLVPSKPLPPAKKKC